MSGTSIGRGPAHGSNENHDGDPTHKTLGEGATDDIVSRALINGMVHMADTLGMRTVASQVDTTGKLRAVMQLGVDYAQGYRLRHPQPIEDFSFVDCGIQRPVANDARV